MAINWPAQNAQFLGAKLPPNIIMVAIVPSILIVFFFNECFGNDGIRNLSFNRVECLALPSQHAKPNRDCLAPGWINPFSANDVIECCKGLYHLNGKAIAVRKDVHACAPEESARGCAEGCVNVHGCVRKRF